MPEPEAAGAVDVAALLNHVRAIHKPYGYHGICAFDAERWPCDTSLLADALTASTARAERLAEAAREVLDDFAHQVKEQPVMADCDPLDFYSEPMLRLRAALAGDASGRGEQG